MTEPPCFQIDLRNRQRVAVIDERGPVTYGQMSDAAAQVRSGLLEGQHDLSEQRIAFLVPPGRDYVAVQWGIWQAGGVAVPLAVSHPRPELEYVIDDADVSAVIVASAYGDCLASILDKRSIPLIPVERFREIIPHEQRPEFDGSRRAMILYTSGSTGRPKGVVTTHANILAQIEALIEAWEWQPADQILHVLPLHHIHGIINVLGCAMRVGATCEFLPRFDAAQVWERFQRGNLSLFMAVPTIYAKLIGAWSQASPDQQRIWSQGARRLRLMVSGSAALPVSTLETWERITGHRLLERYGMTEIGMALSNPLRGERRPGHVGIPLPNVEIRRVGTNDEPLDDATPGELEVRGPNVFLEYWRREQETRDAFRDGWFRTGDVAIVEQGSYRILGRNSVDIIKTGGYKVSALEIEEVLRTHSQIVDCAVVGVPDDEWGERVAACVVSRESDSLELESIREWCKQRLAPYKAPTLLHLCDELPRNAMGKVQKPLLKDLF